MTYNEVISKLAENVKLIDTYIKAVFVPEIPEGQFIKVVFGDRLGVLYVHGNGWVFFNDYLLEKVDNDLLEANFKDYADLCLHWLTVKADLGAEVKRLNTINDIVMDFEV